MTFHAGAPDSRRRSGSRPTGAATLDTEAVFEALDTVKDPEIPVVSVVELGIVQDVRIATAGDGTHVEVDITPTFSGCPALEMMRREIGAAVRRAGAADVTVNVVLSPPWTSDRITPVARERMRSLGLEPPPLRAAPRFAAELELSPRAAPGAAAPFDEAPVACPFCGSSNTRLTNAFGPTICRTLHHCDTCQQPFEAFKAL